MTAPLAAFDQALKERGLNPGTSADLTVATLFAAALMPSTARNEAEKRPSSRRTIDLPISQPPAYVLPAELQPGVADGERVSQSTFVGCAVGGSTVRRR